MEYSETLTNQEYLDNFKCCRNCAHWDRDPTLMGDYAYNNCRYWFEKTKKIFAPKWAAFCEGYNGTKTNEGPFHKLVYASNQLVFEHIAIKEGLLIEENKA